MLILKKLLIVIGLALPIGVNASSIDYTLSYVSGEQLEGPFTGGRQVSANGTPYQTRTARGCNGRGSG